MSNDRTRKHEISNGLICVRLFHSIPCGKAQWDGKSEGFSLHVFERWVLITLETLDIVHEGFSLRDDHIKPDDRGFLLHVS